VDLGSISGRLSGKVGQMNAAKPRLVVLEKQASETRPKSRNGAAQMREAADMFMEQDCFEIAEVLSKNSKNGQIQSIKFMYELSEKKTQSGEGEGARKFRSFATEWANSPEWEGPSPEEKSNEVDEVGDNS
jgi:hypothetical protein